MSTIIGQRAAARRRADGLNMPDAASRGGAVEAFLHYPATRMALPFVNGGLSGMVSLRGLRLKIML